jgi:hypothetical protein
LGWGRAAIGEDQKLLNCKARKGNAKDAKKGLRDLLGDLWVLTLRSLRLKAFDLVGNAAFQT